MRIVATLPGAHSGSRARVPGGAARCILPVQQCTVVDGDDMDGETWDDDFLIFNIFLFSF